MHHPTYKSLKAAYAFYNVVTSAPWTEVINDALIIAKNVRDFSVVLSWLQPLRMEFLPERL